MGRQIFAADEAAAIAHVVFDRLGDLAFIEGVAVTAGDGFEGGRKCRVAEGFAMLRSVAVGEIDVAETWQLAIDGCAGVPRVSDDLRDRESIAGITNRGLQY